MLSQMTSKSQELSQGDIEFKEKAIPVAEKLGKLDEDYSKLKPPELTPLPKPPEETHTDPWKTWGSPAMWIATFGSMMTRHSLTNALNAASGVMKSANDKDATQTKHDMDLWKANTENAVKMHNFEMDAYKAALDKYAGDKGALSAEITALTAAFKNPTGSTIFMTKGVDEFRKYLEDADKKAKDLVKTMPQVEANRIYQDKLAANPNATPEQKTQWLQESQAAAKGTSGSKSVDFSGVDWKNGDPNMEVPKTGMTLAAIAQAARGVEKTGNFNGGGLGIGWNPAKQAVHDYIAATNPSFDLGTAKLKFDESESKVRAEGRTFGSTSERIKIASSLLDESLPSLMEIAKKVDNGRSMDLNSLYNNLKKRLSSQDFANFSTQLRAVTSDYAQFIGRGNITVHSDEEALRILNEDMGITSLQGFVDGVTAEKKNVKRGLDKVENDTGGKNNEVLDVFSADADKGKVKDAPLPMPEDMQFHVGSYYDTPHGVAKYLGGGRFE